MIKLSPAVKSIRYLLKIQANLVKINMEFATMQDDIQSINNQFTRIQANISITASVDPLLQMMEYPGEDRFVLINTKCIANLVIRRYIFLHVLEPLDNYMDILVNLANAKCNLKNTHQQINFLSDGGQPCGFSC